MIIGGAKGISIYDKYDINWELTSRFEDKYGYRIVLSLDKKCLITANIVDDQFCL